MPALLINIRIDEEEKLEFFKVTLSDLAEHFAESHVKIRGRYAAECVAYAQACLRGAVHTYQELQEKDWIAATLEMVGQAKSRSVFLYFEDHKLVAPAGALRKVLAAFDASRLDYLCYSFFRASQLDARNVLPLGAVRGETFSEFRLTDPRVEVLGRISPNFYTFSLVSLVSIEYFKAILKTGNAGIKVHLRALTAVLTRLFRYPRYRRVVGTLNAVLSRIGVSLALYHPSSPFNLEKLWFESIPSAAGWKYGILHSELFANYDDDNRAYGESLIKKGLYPFKADQFDLRAIGRMRPVVTTLSLKAGDSFDCAYHSHVERIRQAPVVQIASTTEAIEVRYQGVVHAMAAGEARYFYANLSPVIVCMADSEVQIKVFDEIFQ